MSNENYLKYAQGKYLLLYALLQNDFQLSISYKNITNYSKSQNKPSKFERNNQNIIKTLKYLYKLKNKKIKSYLIFIYDRENSGLSRDIGKLIPEKNILSERFVKQPEEKIDTFEKIEVYSSKYSGFGKTTEIIHEIKDKGGLYYYLPIGVI